MHITPQQPVETGIPSNRRDNLKQICIPGGGYRPLGPDSLQVLSVQCEPLSTWHSCRRKCVP